MILGDKRSACDKETTINYEHKMDLSKNENKEQIPSLYALQTMEDHCIILATTLDRCGR